MQVNKDNTPEWYSETQFLAVFYSRDIADVNRAIMNILHCSYPTARRRVKYGTFDHEETAIIARAVQPPMTPREYCNCFLSGVFQAKDTTE